MLYRSSHMPTITAIPATNVPRVVRVAFRDIRASGMKKQPATIVQNGTANGPEILAQKARISAGSPP
jgi:hypothetical protein